AQQVGEKREHLYKILVIGELGTGKTSIIKRYVHQFFSQHYRATIGVDFALKVLNWDANTIIRLQLWDIAGILQNDKLINHSDSARDLEKFALDGKNQRNQKNGKTCSC
ncbi:Ras-related protein Rab-32, partial [Blattella germanica]